MNQQTTNDQVQFTYRVKANGRSMRSMLAEQNNFGEYSTKTARVNFILSQEEKEELRRVSEKLDMPMNLLLRVLLRKAVIRHDEGKDILDGFKMP